MRIATDEKMVLRLLIAAISLFMFAVMAAAQGPVAAGGYRPTEEELARYKRLGELLRHPTFIRLRLISSGRDRPGTEPSTTPTPYAIDESMHFRLFITQDSSENLIIGKGAAPYDYLVKLIRDGDIVSYSKDVQQKVDRIESELRNPRWSVSLAPGQEYPLDYVLLEDWYDSPLKPGNYQLTVRKQFAPGGDWVESNPVTFDVISPNASQPISQDQVDLDALDQKLQHHLQARMPGWSYERIEPIQGSRGVLLQKWTFANRGISIAVTPMKSAEEAKKAILNFPAVAKEARFLADIGDEAYAWGYDRRQLHFRRGRTIFDVEAGANVDSDPDARSLTWAQRRAREKAEITRLTRETAKHLTEAIDAP